MYVHRILTSVIVPAGKPPSNALSICDRLVGKLPVQDEYSDIAYTYYNAVLLFYILTLQLLKEKPYIDKQRPIVSDSGCGYISIWPLSSMVNL